MSETFYEVRRLKKQEIAVWRSMLPGHWRTLRQIADDVGAGEASVSARLRDLRRFGESVGHFTIEKRKRHQKPWEYRYVRLDGPTQQALFARDEKRTA